MKTVDKTTFQTKANLLKTTRIKRVFTGTGKQHDPLGSCSEECVGGTANTKAMEATNLNG